MFGNPNTQTNNMFGQGAQQPVSNPFGGGGGLNQNQSTNANLFGNQNQNNMQAAKPFGNNQGGGLFGATNTSTTSNGMFGGGMTQNTGGMFGAQQQPSNQGGGIFGAQNNNTTNPFTGGNKPQGGGLFGGNQQQTNGGIFGGNTQGQQNSGNGIFGGGNNQNQGGGIFGQNQNNFGNNGQTPSFGTNQNNSNSMFGTTNTNQPNNIFGGGGQSNSPFGGTTGFLGGQNNQPQNNIFGGSNQPATSTGIFGGGNTQTQGGLNMFGAQNNQTQQQGGTLFGQTNQPTKSPFGGFNTNTNSTTGTNSLWGGTQNTTTSAWNANTNANNAAFTAGQSNQFGGTSWGVNVTGGMQGLGMNMNKGGSINVVPVKSKNSKIDNKHLVKCISAMDQYLGLSKEEIRCHFLLTGGMPNVQPVVNDAIQQQGLSNGTLFNKPANNNGPMPSFGQLGNTVGSTLFGNQPTSNNLGGFNNAAKPAGNNLFGANQNQGSTLFGGQQTNQGASMFGQTQPQTQTPGGNLFGQNQNQGFGLSNAQQQQQQGSLFGSNNTQQPGGNLFGANQTGSLFGNNNAPQNNTGTLFGGGGSNQLNNQPNTGTLFGNQAPNNNTTQNTTQATLFGATTQLFGATQQSAPQSGSLFGNPAQSTGTGSSLFGATNNPTNTGQTGSLFGGTQQAQTSLFGANTGSAQLNNTQQQSSLFGNSGGLAQPTSTQGSSLFGGQQNQVGGSLFNQQPQNTQFLSMQQPFSNPNNMNLFLSVPLQKNILSNQAILDPNYQNNKNQDLMTILLGNLVQQHLLKQEDVDKLLAPTPFQQLMKKAEEQKQKYDFSNENVKSSAKFPILDYNFKKWQLSEDYLQQRDPDFWETKYLQSLGKKKQFKVRLQPPKNKKQPLFDIKKQNQKKAATESIKKGRRIQDYQMFLMEEGYQIKPSLQRIRMMDIYSIQKVPDVQISNKFGRAKFLQPIPLYRRDLKDCLQIQQNCIQIKDKQWDRKRCQLQFYNFSNFTNQKQQGKKSQIKKKMMKWVQKNNMKYIKFDERTGNLTVKVFDC